MSSWWRGSGRDQFAAWAGMLTHPARSASTCVEDLFRDSLAGVAVATTLCRRHRPACWPARHVQFSGRNERGYSAYVARAAAPHIFDMPTERLARLTSGENLFDFFMA